MNLRLSEVQLEMVRDRVRAGIEEIAQGEFTEYIGKEGLSELAASIKARGRKSDCRKETRIAVEDPSGLQVSNRELLPRAVPDV